MIITRTLVEDDMDPQSGYLRMLDNDIVRYLYLCKSWVNSYNKVKIKWNKKRYYIVISTRKFAGATKVYIRGNFNLSFSMERYGDAGFIFKSLEDDIRLIMTASKSVGEIYVKVTSTK